MKPVSAIATNIVSLLGLDTTSHWRNIVNGKIGVRQYTDEALSPVPFFGSRIEPAQWQVIHDATRASMVLSPFEQMCIYSARQALQGLEAPLNLDETILILSTTKGNIEWLGQVEEGRLLPHNTAQIIAAQLGLKHKPLVISHACVSGVTALLYAQRLLQSGRYKNTIVVGADRLTKFVLSGFQSFQAISDQPCRPFDAERKGINLGEAAATIILSADDEYIPLAHLLSGSTSNDANHISGPSRTGEELALAIKRAMEAAGLDKSRINMISAHGTATLYNDEMEAKAFGIAGIAHAPLHSFKGYIGHTLGAAGVVESAMIVESLLHQQLIASPGFATLGVSQQLNVITSPIPAQLDFVLKTASGFGGCNAVAIWSKPDIFIS